MIKLLIPADGNVDNDNDNYTGIKVLYWLCGRS